MLLFLEEMIKKKSQFDSVHVYEKKKTVSSLFLALLASVSSAFLIFFIPCFIICFLNLLCVLFSLTNAARVIYLWLFGGKKN